MEQTYFFIERTDTKEWYYVKRTTKPDDFSFHVHDNRIYLIPSWTDDPLVAQRFCSKDMAESFMKYDTVFKRDHACMVTEYVFRISRNEKK